LTYKSVLVDLLKSRQNKSIKVKQLHRLRHNLVKNFSLKGFSKQHNWIFVKFFGRPCVGVGVNEPKTVAKMT